MRRVSTFVVVAIAVVGCKADKPASVEPPAVAAQADPPAAEDDDVDRSKVFTCTLDSTGRHDCAVSRIGCAFARRPCNEQPEAWCFPSTATWRGRKFPTTPCAIDRDECERWRQQRVDHPEPPTGPCALTPPSGYIDPTKLIVNAAD